MTVKILSTSVDLTIEAFKARPCSLPAVHPDYVPPTAQDVKSLRHLIGYSQTDLGALGNKSVNTKGCSAVRKWETIEGNADHRPMDYCLWRLMLYVAGIASVSDDVEAVKQFKSRVFK
jgi:hypothetical protein